jgi:hypothetical protein
MALNPQYIPLYQLQQYFVDKVTGTPLAGGLVYFYSDVNRTVPKTVYELSSTTGTYTYVPLPNPIVLSSVGTPVDNNGNDIVIYAFPFDPVTGDSELYYVVVQDSLGRPQFTREAVPGISGSGTPSTNAGLFNYIPNGQFLVHTNLSNPTGTLVAGSNVIAQGGFTVELSNPLNSVNTLTFQELGFTEAPPNSPRYEAIFACTTPSTMDTIKNFRIKWNDVNKFSSNDDFFTFAFWAESAIAIPISIQIYKFFGTTGTVLPPETKFTDTIEPGANFYQYQLQFGTNVGDVVDLINNNDFVAIDISFPTNIGFSVSLTNFLLVLGQQVITEFPLQTNADMITRGNDGWTDNPKPNGYDLYLPKVQTRIGYQYDYSQIGQIQATIGNIVSPLSVSPLPISNDMLLDGTSYIYANYSTIGIPFARLGDFLIANSPVANTPIFGTGANFATAYVNHGDDTKFRLTVNSNGVGVNPAIDGTIPFNTGFTFTRIPTYNFSTTGSASFNYVAYNSGLLTNEIFCKSNFQPQIAPNSVNRLIYSNPGDSGFTVMDFDWYHELYSQQSLAFFVDTVPGAALITGGNGLFFWFYTDAAQTAALGKYVWFNTGTEVDPVGIPPVGFTPIEVRVNPTDTAQDVANTLREVMNAYQSTDIDVTGIIPPAGSYFTFQSNPGGIRNFYVWYKFNGVGNDPLIPGSTGIEVDIVTGDTDDIVLIKTLTAINKYQYAVPAAQGMFLRNSDPNGIWDFDNLTRWSNVTGITGPSVGTFEYGQLLSHLHAPQEGNNSDTRSFAIRRFVGDISTSFVTPGNLDMVLRFVTDDTGGSETRPVNMYVNYYIKY